ncbi:60S acidic ribosomal protein P2, putative [Eimeria necatrix]|uniref:60S acidic ribosomal protein P2, putative n=1 Tax=Eimeria necatrix TaxID=51315 RepID=U6MU67_9EIME|nr:60S acidic ribosomal protein P2, putative [Eimeria necatrix]CDJ67772.1 60S acidic ribosomal protein P2, putative [Eimeria necatrix]
MTVLGGNEAPTAADVSRVLEAVGAEVNPEVLKTLIDAMQGKTAHEVISAGLEKLQKVPCGGGAAAAAAPAAAAAAAGGGDSSSAAKDKKKEEPEEEEEDADMGLSLFD